MAGPEGNRTLDQLVEKGSASREQAVREDLMKRLRNVCAHLSEADFRDLVQQMAERQIRGEHGKPFS